MLSSWVSRNNGGVFEAVVAQADLVCSLGGQPIVLGIRDEVTDTDAWRLDGFETWLVPGTGPGALAYARDLVPKLAEARLDLLHLHGIWQYPTHAAGRWASQSGKPLIISPHGMLDPWITRRNAWKKHAARLGWERRAWKQATAFHALTSAEAADVRAEASSARILTIPNPAPPLAPFNDSQRSPALLYLGRIHEKKNIAALVAAWYAARAHLPADATLTIAGWGDDAGIAMLERAMRNQVDDSVMFVGTAFGAQKAALFDVSRFLILPSVSEGLPMVILEAWSAGVPTLQSEACHLPEGYAQGAAMNCGTDVEEIRDAIVAALNMPHDQWQTISAAARGLASGPFSSEVVARQWSDAYCEALASG